MRNEIEVNKMKGYKMTEDTTEASKRRGGRIMVTHAETGEQVARVDYIRELAESGLSRREITDQLNAASLEKWLEEGNAEEDFKEMRYQIVFQATRDMDVTPSKRKRKAKKADDVDVDESEE
jgi:hypothetical protein